MKYVLILTLLSTFSVKSSLPLREIDDLVERLEIHISQLQDFHAQYKFIDECIFDGQEIKSNSIIGTIPFNHSLIKWCIKTMEKRRNLAPFFDAWETFKAYRYIDGLQAPLFIQECAILIFVIYNNILLKISPNFQRVSLQEINDLFNQISALPIHDLINMLDKIQKELSVILAEHSLKPNQTITQWIKENWWVPPTVVAGIIVAILFKQ